MRVRFLSILLIAAISLCSAFGCTKAPPGDPGGDGGQTEQPGDPSEPEDPEVPEPPETGYQAYYIENLGKDVIPVSAWVNPSPYLNGSFDSAGTRALTRSEMLSRYRTYREAGLNTVYSFKDSYDLRASIVKQSLDVCGELGLAYMVSDSRLYASEIKQSALDSVKKGLSSYSAFSGFMIWDEPSADFFDTIASGRKLVKETFPDKSYIVNLFPNYASGAQLGAGSYEEYIERYLSEVKNDFLSYDNYAFASKRESNLGTVTGNYFFNNMSAVRRQTLSANVPFWAFAQTSAFQSGAIVPNEAEIDWQVNAALAYGAKGIQYFTYWLPPSGGETFAGGIVDLEGEKTSVYAPVQRMNAQISAIGPYLMKSLSKGIVMTGSPPFCNAEKTQRLTVPQADLISSYGKLKSASGGNALVGCFDYRGDTLLYVTNNDFTAESEITLSFDGAPEIDMIRSAVKSSQPGKTSLTLKLSAGEGVLIHIK